MAPRGKIISLSPDKTALQYKAASLPAEEEGRTRSSKLGTNQEAVCVKEFISRNF
jgi:hypothetical protein